MKKFLILSVLILSLTIIFLACSEERDHASPFDPEYWEKNDIQPSNLNVEYETITSAKISWLDNSIEDKFIIERKLSSSTEWILIAEIDGDYQTGIIKSYIDNTVDVNLIYDYRVFSCFADYLSKEISKEYLALFPSPSNPVITIINENSLKLTWTDNSIGEEGFKIDKKTGNNEWIINYAEVNSNTKEWTDNSLIIGEIFLYRLRAFYNSFYTEYTNEATASIAPNGFIYLPSGSFSMGQTDVATPVHTVNITRPFYLGKYEVTQKEWYTRMGINPASGYGVGDYYPVYNVSWYKILVYCNKRSIAEGLTPCYTISGSTDPSVWGSVPTSFNSTWNAVTCNFSAEGYRLPTEAEWEYAARYNDGRTYPWGETAPSSTLCNYNSNVGGTTVVGSYQSGNSNLGLCDMAGNVWEWVWDWSATYPSTTETDPDGPDTTQTTRVLRGGSWNSSLIRCASRGFNYPPLYGLIDGGFRLARTK